MATQETTQALLAQLVARFETIGGIVGATGAAGANAVLGAAPATATSAGVAGSLAKDANFLYVCTATNTWKRVAIATW